MIDNYALFSHFCTKLNHKRAMEEEILTIKDVAAYLKLTEKTAYRLVLNDKIPGFKIGGSWRFRKIEIDEWIKDKSNRRTGNK